MAKSSKKSKDAALGEVTSAASMSEAQNGTSPQAPEKNAPAKSSSAAAKPARKPRRAASRKPAAGEKVPKSPVRKKPAPAEVAVSDEEIRLRAYFLAERRMRDGIDGDSARDWLEARRQLLEEAARRA